MIQLTANIYKSLVSLTSEQVWSTGNEFGHDVWWREGMIIHNVSHAMCCDVILLFRSTTVSENKREC